MADASFFLDLYRSDLQSFWALWVLTALFVVWLVLSASARATRISADPDLRFVHGYCVVFGIESVLDPIATGPLVALLGADPGGTVATAVLIGFVLLGDFRVLLLLFRMASPSVPLSTTARDAALWTLFVPAVALGSREVLAGAFGDLPPETIWLLYELAFLGLALWMHRSGLPRWVEAGDERRLAALRAIAAYVAFYYALWAIADVLILVFGLDLGWALRMVPNQLYYVFYLPFVYFQLSSRR